MLTEWRTRTETGDKLLSQFGSYMKTSLIYDVKFHFKMLLYIYKPGPDSLSVLLLSADQAMGWESRLLVCRNIQLSHNQSTTSSAERPSLVSKAGLWLFTYHFEVNHMLLTWSRLRKKASSAVLHADVLCKTMCKSERAIKILCTWQCGGKKGLLSLRHAYAFAQKVFCFCSIELAAPGDGTLLMF